MDQLDLLKKDWKKQEDILPKLSRDELSKLIHKKSSSIVKWIFIISVLEFVIPLTFLSISGMDKSSMKVYEDLGLSTFIKIFYVVTSAVILFFIYRFYKNYKSIDVYSSPKILLQNILNTRKIVTYYIWFNLATIPLVLGVVLYKLIYSPSFIHQLPEGTNILVIILLTILVTLVLIGLFWLFYRLIYGILLNRLKKNYNELISNETNNC